MLHTVTPWNLVADGYAATTMQSFKPFIEAALQHLPLGHTDVVLDLACGPGTLALMAAKQCQQVDAVDFSPEMIRVLQHLMQQQQLSNIRPVCADGQQLPYADASFDAVFSMFGLMFFPNRPQAYAEIWRTLKPGGQVLLSSWAPISRSSAMQAMFGALRQIKPDLPEPQANIASLENPDFFRDELMQAGFTQVVVEPCTGYFPVSRVAQFWHYMVQGSAPIVMLRHSMSAEAWAAGEKAALDYLHALLQTPTQLSSDAWLARAQKP